jgi:hypothetical protein
MNSFASLVVLTVVLGPALRAQAIGSSVLRLSPERIPTNCKIIDGYFPVDIQTAILWDKTDLYKSLIPPPVAKSAQSFACDGDKGTVYSFQFGDEAKRKTAAAFIKPLLWGESGPTTEHPELVLEAVEILRIVSFRKTPKLLLAAIQGDALLSAAGPPKTESSDFSIPGHGSLRLKLPDAWRTQSRALAEPASVYLHSVPPNGDAFDIQVTAVWLDPEKLSRQTNDSLRSTAQHTADDLLPHSIEKTATIHDLRGPKSVGFYYALTDNNPGQGEFTYVTQGVFLTGEVLSTFTILHRTALSREADQAIQAFSAATYVK